MYINYCLVNVYHYCFTKVLSLFSLICCVSIVLFFFCNRMSDPSFMCGSSAAVFLLQAVRPEAFGMDLRAWSTVIIPSVVQANANINLFVQQRQRASAENYGSSVPNAILPSPLKWGVLSFRKLLLRFEFIRLVVADYTSNFTAPSGHRDQYSLLSFPHIEMEQDEWFTV